MDFYRFVVTDFQVLHTRAKHEDTLWLSHTVHADGDLVAHDFEHLGDFNNGDYNVQSYVHGGHLVGIQAVVLNDPLAKVSFTFQLLNSGNASAAAVNGRVIATADQLAGIAAGAAALGAVALPVGLGLEAFANFYAWLTVDCDGPVAVDQISGPRYGIDATADDDPTGTISIVSKNYPGTDSPDLCGGNSNYDVTWLLQHWRGWSEVTGSTPADVFASAVGVGAARHNGAVHAFGLVPGTGVTHARTFSGASWYIDTVPDVGGLAELTATAVSFDDRLYVFGVKTDGSVAPLAYTVDGGSWSTPAPGPAGLVTTEPVAAAAFRSRLYVFARDSTTGALRVTSSADVMQWEPWTDVPTGGLGAMSAVAAAALGDTLHLFGLHDTKKPPESNVVVHNSTGDGAVWAGWDVVENGARPEGQPSADQPLDVSATEFDDRVYIASRWGLTNTDSQYMAVNFSGDGENWSGWRQPESPTLVFRPGGTAGLAAAGNHLYVLAPTLQATEGANAPVSAH